MDKLIVRLTIVILTIYMEISTIFAWYGISFYEYDSIFSCSAMFGLLLTVLVHSQGRYHCVYMRGLCYNLILSPLLSFADIQLELFEDADTLIITLSSMWILSVSSTIYLAIRHFIKVKKLKSERNEIHKING